MIERNPFASIDVDGVGELVRIGVERGRAAKPGIKLGICGEHGGDPASVEFFHGAGLDYVSCSPFRVPIARLAAARAALGDRRRERARDRRGADAGRGARSRATSRSSSTRSAPRRRRSTRCGRAIARSICCGSVDDARAAAAEIGEGAILAGERECVRIEGFHLGNSPREFDAGQPLGDVLVLTTTNGTRAVLQAQSEAAGRARGRARQPLGDRRRTRRA